MLLKGIVLECARKLKTERSTAAIYHLLTGKKSIQTVQDAHIYELASFYGVYKTLTKQVFDSAINEFIQEEMIQVDDDSHCQVTAQGLNWLQEHKQECLFEHYNGLQFHILAPVFSDRLLLVIQTLTNSNRNYFSFIPIIDKTPIQLWTKTFFKSTRGNEQQILTSLYKEIYRLLSSFSTLEANLFVERLTGYKTYGKSSQQLAHEFHLSLTDVHLIWTRIIHQMITMVMGDTSQFPNVYKIIQDQQKTRLITESAETTYRLYLDNYSLEQIAEVRNLKLNTIYDHINEIALIDPTFPIAQFVSELQQKQITEAVERTKSLSLKQIKQSLEDNISYFQIRLVIGNIQRHKPS